MAGSETQVEELIERARAAQQKVRFYSQEEVDELVTAVAWAVVRQDRAEELAQLAVDESGLGNYDDKVDKIRKRVIGVLADSRDTPTVGVVENDPDAGLVKIAKPVGVVAALMPATGPDATPPVKALFALNGRNAIIVSPHPATEQTAAAVVESMRRACAQVGAPEDLIQVLGSPTLETTQQLMEASDLVVATGGAGMVRAAYSSGTPAYGVGVGNSVHVVDTTADLETAAGDIADAKTFDSGTSCLADNAVVAHAQIYDELVDRLVAAGGYLCDQEEKQRLAGAMWPEGGAVPDTRVIAKPASRIADLADITLPEDRTFLMVEDDGAGPDHPFSGEKLSVVLALYRYDGGIQSAVEWVNRITAYQGHGHTCGIHTDADEHVDALAHGTQTARVIVNQNLNEGAGSPRNRLPYTLSLGCGTWGGNITTENINARHFVNLTWVSRPTTPPRTIDEQALFADHWERYGR